MKRRLHVMIAQTESNPKTDSAKRTTRISHKLNGGNNMNQPATSFSPDHSPEIQAGEKAPQNQQSSGNEYQLNQNSNLEIHPAVYRACAQTDKPVFPISLDPRTFSSKPTDKDYGTFTNYVRGNPPVFVDVDTFVEHICKGCIFSPAVYKPGQKSRNGWAAQQLIVIDLDHTTMNLDELHTYFAERDLAPNLIYASWRCTPETPKYHVCFVLDGVMTDIRIFSLIMSIVKELCPEADPKVLLPHANVNGSHANSILYSDFTRQTPLMDLINNFLVRQHAKDPTNFPKWLDTFCAKHYLYRLDNVIDMAAAPLVEGVSFCLFDFLYHDTTLYYSMCSSYNTMSNTGFSTVTFPVIEIRIPFHIDETTMYLTAPSFPDVRCKEVVKTKSINRDQYTAIGEESIEELSQNCQLFREFISGETRLNHHQRFGLQTNIAHSRDGLKWMKVGLNTRSDYDAYAEKKTVNEFKYIERSQYSPMKCVNIDCPYYFSCQRNGYCPIHQIRPKRHSIRQIADPPSQKSLTDTRQLLKDTLVDIYACADNNVHVIACDTGVGKTEAFLSLPLKNTCVAFPTHQLKDEALTRAFSKALPGIFDWPKRPVLPEPYEKLLRHYESIDLGMTFTLMQHVGLNVFGDQYYYNDYREAVFDVTKASLIFGTHDKIFTLNNPNINTYIIDEDISARLFDNSVVRAKDISFLLRQLCANKCKTFEPMIELLDKADRASSRTPTLNTAKIDMNTWVEQIRIHSARLTSPVVSLATCDAFLKNSSGDIVTARKRTLKPDAKYIVFSATANEAVYRMLFGDRLRFIDLRNTQTRGTVYLHHRYSYTKHCIERIGVNTFVQNVVQDQKEFGFEGIITHKEYVQERNGDYFLLDSPVKVFTWFGNLEGLNAFRGKNLAIYGVPHQPEEVYQLTALLATGEYNESFCHPLREMVIKRNEWEFTMVSSPDETIRDIQLHMIESQLIQAVGRSRHVTEPCDVHLFGNFPLPNCVLDNNSVPRATSNEKSEQKTSGQTSEMGLCFG